MQERYSKREWIAGLSSCVLHLVALLALAAWTVGVGLGISGNSISIESGDSTDSEMQAFEIASAALDASEVNPSDSKASLAASSTELQRIADAVRESSSSIEQDQDLANDLLEQSAIAGGAGGETGISELSLTGRTSENRARLAIENGGSPESEQAVELALEYLAEHQLNDGSWSMMFDESCQGECTPSASGRNPYRYAATGLALLCFLGAGKTTEDEKFGITVSKGVYFLQQTLRMESDKGYWVGTESSAQMYEHGIATLALCEAYGMMRSGELKDTCQLAVEFIVYAQFRDGGWDYHPKSPGDLSIVGWQAMALKSAFSAKLTVPMDTIRGIDRFLDKNRAGEFMFKYRTSKPTQSMTAIGILMQIFRGRSRDARSIERGIEYLAKQGPSHTDVYYNYYATQALFQTGGMFWKNWNYKMRDFLIRTQVPDGHLKGSWYFDGDPSNKAGGRLYTTCMACLILEVYYRYLPVYREREEKFQF
ncbi:MAG: prenyltransferase/squalene oxidase repeat-containing protein [Planctomycetota bacterium]